jgi:DNA-binding response OmpR family regulator
MKNHTHIMIIEDDNSMRSLLRTLLEIERFEVTAPDQHSENSLLNQINENRPDIVLMDVYLSQLNGLDLLKKIRQNADGYQPKVIMSSGENLSENCRDAGADNFLLKPYMPADLISLLHSLE